MCGPAQHGQGELVATHRSVAELADVRDGNTGPPGNELVQMRQVGGDDEDRRLPVSRFCLLRFFYRGRGHHRVYCLPGGQRRSADEVSCPSPYGFADRLDGHAGQHVMQAGITAVSAKDFSKNRRRSQHTMPIVIGHLQPHILYVRIHFTGEVHLFEVCSIPRPLLVPGGSGHAGRLQRSRARHPGLDLSQPAVCVRAGTPD